MGKEIVGSRFKSENCGWFVVEEYSNCKSVVIKFELTGYVKKVEARNVYSGLVKDKLHPVVYGVGYLGEGGYVCSKNGENTRVYKTWKGLLSRCYSEKWRSSNPTYEDCSVCSEWHNFQEFAKYYEANYKEGLQLDKDLLFKGNKLYSEDTCVFVPAHINSFTIAPVKKACKYKRGVSYHKRSGTFTARIHDGTGKKEYLGSFSTEHLAYEAWLSAKLKQAFTYKPEFDRIDERIYNTVLEIIKDL